MAYKEWSYQSKGGGLSKAVKWEKQATKWYKQDSEIREVMQWNEISKSVKQDKQGGIMG